MPRAGTKGGPAGERVWPNPNRAESVAYSFAVADNGGGSDRRPQHPRVAWENLMRKP